MSVHARTDTWVEIVSDLLDRPPGAAGPREVLGPLGETFDAAASWSWARPGGSFGFVATGLRAAWPGADVLVEWACDVRGRHPLLRWYALSEDPAPLTLARVPMTVTTARDRARVRSFYLELGLEQQLCLPVLLDGGRHEAFVLGRTGDDFSEEDVEVARRLQPLLRLLRRQTEVLDGPRLAPSAGRADLSGREAAVLGLLADGLTARSIGRRLGISERTVHKHLEHVYRKLGTRDRLGTVVAATAAGLLDSPDPPWPGAGPDALLTFTWPGEEAGTPVVGPSRRRPSGPRRGSPR